MESGLTWARRKKGYGPVVLPWGGIVAEGEDCIMPEDEVRDREDWEVAGEHEEPEPEAVAPPSTKGWAKKVTEDTEPVPVVEEKPAWPLR